AEVAGEPIIVVRGKDGALRAFFNVCRHRGGPLAMKDGNADMLMCKYHGWTYRLDGMLRGVPHFNRVELFDKRDYGLTPVHLAEWEGVVFVSLAERPKPLETSLKDIRERVAPTDIGKLTFARWRASTARWCIGTAPTRSRRARPAGGGRRTWGPRRRCGTGTRRSASGYSRGWAPGRMTNGAPPCDSRKAAISFRSS